MRQYGNSPIIQQLVANLQAYFDVDAAIDEFYNKIWNIDTANSFGLDIWGRIVGIGRTITTESDTPFFGFETTNDSFVPFDQGTFYDDDRATTTYTMDDDMYRKVILCKAMSNIVRPNAQTINSMLQYLFDGKRCYVLDTGGMSMRYVFAFYLKNWQKTLVTSDILPRPAGVLVEIVEIPQPNIIGFSEAGSSSATFDQGTWYNPELSVLYST